MLVTAAPRKKGNGLMRDYSMFIAPYSASDEGDAAGGITDIAGLDNLLDQMGNEPPAGEPAGDGNGTPDQTQTPEQNDNTQQQNIQTKPTADDKRNFAFGQMRTEISHLTDLLGRVAKANGIEYSDSKDLVAKLNDDAIAKMAQKQNVPVELLKEIEILRQDSAAFKAQQLKDAAAIGFQNVMNTYGLTQDQLKEFAVELDQAGKNPFAQPVDILAEYKMMHYDDILKAEVQKAVEEALKKDSAANQSSSTPGQQQGSNGGGETKITTVAGLTALLDGMK